MYKRKDIGATAILGWADISKGAEEGGGYNLVALNHALKLLENGNEVFYLQSGIDYNLSQLIGIRSKGSIRYKCQEFGIEQYILYNSTNRAPALFNINNRKYQLSDQKQNQLVISWLMDKHIKQVYIHSLEGQAIDLISDIKDKTDIKIFVICHDHFYICPRVNLLYQGREVCFDYEKGEKCEKCLPTLSFKNYEKTQSIISSRNRILLLMMQAALKLKRLIIKSDKPSLQVNIRIPRVEKVNKLFFNNISMKESSYFGMLRRKKSIQVLQKADMVYAPSAFITKSLINCGLGKDKVKTFRLELPHLIKLENSTRKNTRKSNVVRFCYRGSEQTQKGLSVFLDAIDLLPTDIRKKCRFIIRGPKNIFPFKSYLDRFSQLEIHSVYSTDDPKLFIDEYDIGVLPHIWFENSPVVLLEHLASGKPVLTSLMGGVTDFIREGENGWFFKPGDSLDLSKKITQIVNEIL